jgi:hypothetical protein
LCDVRCDVEDSMYIGRGRERALLKYCGHGAVHSRPHSFSDRNPGRNAT